MLKHGSPTIWCDNIAAVAWVHKFRSNVSDIASNILRVLATRLHVCHSIILSVDHIAGIFNIMADLASQEHTTNQIEFLNLFNKTYPPPQGHSWKLFQFSIKLTSKICSELLMRTSTMGSWRRLSAKGCGFLTFGADGLTPISQTQTITSKTKIDQNKSKYWLPLEHMLDPDAFQVEKANLALKQSRWHIGPSPQQCN